MSIEDSTYFSASYSPNEYRGFIKQVAPTTVLFIHDDVGRGNPSYYKDFISAFCDITEGHLEYRQYKKNFNIDFNFSAIFTSTTAWFYSWKDVMDEIGYLDRVLPLQLELHPDTKDLYRFLCHEAARCGTLSNNPAPRKLSITAADKHEPIDLNSCHVDPRNLRNVLRLSRYLTSDETKELISVITAGKPKYSI